MCLLHRPERAQIDDERVEVVRRRLGVVGERHGSGEPGAVGADAGDDRLLDLCVGPANGRGYLPHEHAVKGKRFRVEYFGATYPDEVAGVGYEPVYDPENLKLRT